MCRSTSPARSGRRWCPVGSSTRRGCCQSMGNQFPVRGVTRAGSLLCIHSSLAAGRRAAPRPEPARFSNSSPRSPDRMRLGRTRGCGRRQSIGAVPPHPEKQAGRFGEQLRVLRATYGAQPGGAGGTSRGHSACGERAGTRDANPAPSRIRCVAGRCAGPVRGRAGRPDRLDSEPAPLGGSRTSRRSPAWPAFERPG
jgi:hypothetical protein